jgi:hypothetical protein
LPRYLEAAAVAAGATEDGDLSESVALMARTNNRNEPIVVPQPLWHASLPPEGQWYARLQRERADLCLQPLYVFHDILMAAANDDFRQEQWRDWEAWLMSFRDMGRRVLGTPNDASDQVGAVRAMAGVTFQLSALQLQQHLQTLRDGRSDPELVPSIDQLRQALDQLRAFENSRQSAIEASSSVVWKPLKLAAGTTALFVAVYLLVYFLAKAVRAGRTSWSIGHPLWSKTLVLLICSFFFVLLLMLTVMQDTDQPSLSGLRLISGAWYGTVGFALLFGVAYPLLALPKPAVAVRNAGLPTDDYRIVAHARRARRIASISMLRRMFGILAGSFVVTVFLWALFFRMLRGLYPLQTDLLVTGLQIEEISIVRQIQEMLL